MPRRKSNKPKTRGFYVPTIFDPETQMPREYHNRVNEVEYILHLIHHYRVTEHKQKSEYIPLKAEYLREVVPGYRDILNMMINNNILDHPQPYIKNVRSTGYRYHPDMGTETHKVEATDLALLKRWDNASARARKRIQWDVHQHLYHWLTQIDLDLDAAQRELMVHAGDRNYGSQTVILDRLAEKDPDFGVCAFGSRVHTSVTNIKSELRHCLKIHGQSLMGIDIVSSQPYFFALVVMNAWRNKTDDSFFLGNIHDFKVEDLNRKFTSTTPYPRPIPPFILSPSTPSPSPSPYDAKLVPVENPDEFNEDELRAISLPKDVKRFASDIVSGQFYEIIQAEYNRASRRSRNPLSRSEIKGKVLGTLYCEKRDEGLTKKIFDRFYPNAMSVLDELKATDYKRPSRCMQRQESWTIIGVIVQRLMRECPEVPVLTVHDSILTTPGHFCTVEAIMIDVFRNLGLVPKLSVTDYGA